MKEFNYSGSWWLPDSQAKVTGDLIFSNQDGLRLDLDTPFDEHTFWERAEANKRATYPIVLGLTKDAKLITLCDCEETSDRIAFKTTDEGSFVYNSAGYDARAAFIGAYFTDAREMQFNRAQVQYDYLPDFVRKQGFTIDRAIKKGILQKYALTYEYPPKITANTSKGEVSVSYTFHDGGTPLEGWTLRQSTALEIRLEQELSLKEFDLNYIRPLQDLISLATNRPNPIISLYVYSKNKVETIVNHIREVPIEVVFQQDPYEERQDVLLSPDKLLFSLQDKVVSERFSEIIERWLNNTDIAELGDVFHLFFGVLYDPDLSQEIEFLNIAFAAELYHRKRFSNEVLPKSEYKARVKSIVDSAPEEHREWLKNALSFSNEPLFRDRIDQLVEITKDVVSPLFSDKDYFVNKVKDTRHYRVHNDRRLEKKAAKNAELFWITKALSYLVRTCLLMELGLTSQDCFELFSKNREYNLVSELGSKFGNQATQQENTR